MKNYIDLTEHGFGRIAKIILFDATLSLMAKALYTLLSCLADPVTHIAVISTGRIMQLLNIGKSAYSSAATQLKAANIISVNQSGRSCNRYTLIDLPDKYREVISEFYRDSGKVDNVLDIGYGLIPYELISAQNISAGAKAVLAYYLVQLVNEKVELSKKTTVLTQLSIDAKTYRKYVRELQENHYVIKPVLDVSQPSQFNRLVTFTFTFSENQKSRETEKSLECSEPYAQASKERPVGKNQGPKRGVEKNQAGKNRVVKNVVGKNRAATNTAPLPEPKFLDDDSVAYQSPTLREGVDDGRNHILAVIKNSRALDADSQKIIDWTTGSLKDTRSKYGNSIATLLVSRETVFGETAFIQDFPYLAQKASQRVRYRTVHGEEINSLRLYSLKVFCSVLDEYAGIRLADSAHVEGDDRNQVNVAKIDIDALQKLVDYV